MEEMLKSLKERFGAYIQHCNKQEKEAAEKSRYDLALKFKEHAFCWEQALNDLMLTEVSYKSGKMDALQSAVRE